MSLGSRVWKPLVELSGCHDDLINGIAVSPDGRYLVSVSQDDSLNTWLCEDVTLMDTTPQRRVYFANNYDNRKFLSKIRPVFDPKHPHSFVVGSMEEPRSLYFFYTKKSE